MKIGFVNEVRSQKKGQLSGQEADVYLVESPGGGIITYCTVVVTDTSYYQFTRYDHGAYMVDVLSTRQIDLQGN
jgi:hypothetical protein